MTISLQPSDIRQEFPITARCVYLDSAYWGPYPARSVRAMSEFARRRSEIPFPDGRADAERKIVDQVRRRIGKLLGVSEQEIWFPRGTTDAINAAASALLKPGDEILVGGLDHPADYTIWGNLADRGIAVQIVPQRDGHIEPGDIESSIGPRTRAIGMCYVNTYNGYRQDLTALSDIASHHGLYLFLDGIQGLGHLDIPLSESAVSVMSAGAYKWMCSPEGLGIGYIRHEIIDQVLPHSVHFYGVEPSFGDWRAFLTGVFESKSARESPITLRPGSIKYPADARRLEISPPVMSLLGLSEVADLMLEFGGMRAVEHRALGLASELRMTVQEHGHRVLSDSSPSSMSAITSVAVASGVGFAEFAKGRNIHVLPQLSPTHGSDAVRVSTHIFNDSSDIHELVRALDDYGEIAR